MKFRQFKQKDQFLVLLAGGIIVLVVFVLSNSRTVKKENPEGTVPNLVPTSMISDNLNGDKVQYDENTRTIVSPVITRPIDNVKYRFTLTVPNDWNIQKIEGNTGYVSLELIKEEYTLDISAPVAGSSTCVYKDEQTNPPHFEIMDKYDAISTSFGTVRVSRIASDDNQNDNIIFRGCQNTLIPRWDTYTKIGYINYRVPKKYNEKIIEEMNTILQKIEYREL